MPDQEKKLPEGPTRGLAGKLTGTFPERLYQARRELGWTASELARRIWGTVPTKDGKYEVARHRDRISSYEKANSTPRRENLEGIASALGLTVAELAPDLVAAEADKHKKPAIAMAMLEGRPNEVQLTINVIASLGAASQVIALLADDPVAAAAAASAE